MKFDDAKRAAAVGDWVRRKTWTTIEITGPALVVTEGKPIHRSRIEGKEGYRTPLTETDMAADDWEVVHVVQRDPGNPEEGWSLPSDAWLG